MLLLKLSTKSYQIQSQWVTWSQRGTVEKTCSNCTIFLLFRRQADVERVRYDDVFSDEAAATGGETATVGTHIFTRGLEIFDPYNIPTVKLQHKQEGQDVLENWNAEYDLYYSQMDRVAKSKFLKNTLRKRYKQGAITDSKVAERQAAINEMSDLPRLRLQFRVESSSANKEDILYLGIMEAKDLPGRGPGRTRANPYCKVNFKPKKMPMEIQTRMKLNTVNPVWKEIVQIAGFPLAIIKRQTLVVRVVSFFPYETFTK